MPKFKVGDSVVVLDGSGIEGYTGGWVPSMENCVGKIYKIWKVHRDYPCGRVYYKLQGLLYLFDERGLEIAKEEPKKLLNTKVRFVGCGSDRLFKNGEIYEVKDGKITDEVGTKLPIADDGVFSSFMELSDYFEKSAFLVNLVAMPLCDPVVFRFEEVKGEEKYLNTRIIFAGGRFVDGGHAKVGKIYDIKDGYLVGCDNISLNKLHSPNALRFVTMKDVEDFFSETDKSDGTFPERWNPSFGTTVIEVVE